MTPPATLDAATRVAACAARCRIDLDPSLQLSLHPLDAAAAEMNHDAPSVDGVVLGGLKPPLKGGTAAQRIMSA